MPITSDNHGSRGAIAVAQELGTAGWGFPLLHDITDVLRIGDVTFVTPNEDVSNYKTVEMKTTLRGEGPEVDGMRDYEYDVTVTFPLGSSDEELPPLPFPQRSAPSDPLIPQRPQRPVARHGRQFERMAKAKVRLDGADGELVGHDGEWSVAKRLESHSGGRWSVLRRVIRNSRETGYASEVVDGAQLYVAFYSKGGVSEEMLVSGALASDVVDSGILVPGDSRNGITVSAMPAPEMRSARPELPYFLYSIPQRARLEMLSGRLLVMVLTNPARIYSALEAAGFEITRGADPHPWSIGVRSAFLDESGNRYTTEARNLWPYVAQMALECKGTDFLVEIVQAMHDACEEAFERGVPDNLLEWYQETNRRVPPRKIEIRAG
ncbi:MAG: hypothetical protein ACYC90_05100 [Candidatus Nanopelagicales bacterium]